MLKNSSSFIESYILIRQYSIAIKPGFLFVTFFDIVEHVRVGDKYEKSILKHAKKDNILKDVKIIIEKKMGRFFFSAMLLNVSFYLSKSIMYHLLSCFGVWSVKLTIHTI